MKKLMLFALVAFSSASMYAQDIKTILSSKDYNEALGLIKSGSSSLTDEDKAKAYNKVVDLALEKFNKEYDVEMKNQVTKGNDPYDKDGMYQAAETALQAAIDCDTYDNMPNAKGKIKPKYGKNNANRLLQARQSLINAGQTYYDAKNYKGAAKAFGMYVETGDANIFKALGQPDAYGTQIAYFAALSAFFGEEYAAADKYADAALNDTTYAAEAMRIKLQSVQAGMKTHEDTLAVTKKVEDIYAKYPTNQNVFAALTSLYLAQNRKADFNALIDKALAANPNDFMAIAMRGQALMNERKWQEAAEDLKKAAELQPTNVAIVASVGNCYMFLAQEKAEQISAKTKGRIPAAAEKVIIEVYNQAIDYLTKAKEMDKNMEYKANWAYSLYTCLYRTLGDEDPKTKEAEALTK